MCNTTLREANNVYERKISEKAYILSDQHFKAKSFRFTPEAEIAFDHLKEALVSSPVLIHPDFARRFYVQCDASDVGVGAVIFQKDDEDGEHPIAYFSHKLTSAQRN